MVLRIPANGHKQPPLVEYLPAHLCLTLILGVWYYYPTWQVRVASIWYTPTGAIVDYTRSIIRMHLVLHSWKMMLKEMCIERVNEWMKQRASAWQSWYQTQVMWPQSGRYILIKESPAWENVQPIRRLTTLLFRTLFLGFLYVVWKSQREKKKLTNLIRVSRKKIYGTLYETL